jgi:NADH:ubiquinone oxidoreductase subunit 3 (subunit A)
MNERLNIYPLGAKVHHKRQSLVEYMYYVMIFIKFCGKMHFLLKIMLAYANKSATTLFFKLFVKIAENRDHYLWSERRQVLDHGAHHNTW